MILIGPKHSAIKIKAKGNSEGSRCRIKHTAYYIIHPFIFSYAITGYQEQ